METLSEIGKTVISLLILLFILTGLRKAVMWAAANYNVPGIVSFLS